MIQRGLVFIFTIFIGTISLFAETTDNRVDRTAWRDEKGTVAESASAAGSQPTISNTIWAKRSFLMTNAEPAGEFVFPKKLTVDATTTNSKETWDEYTDKSNPYPLGDKLANLTAIKVERAAARIDFRDGSKDLTENGNGLTGYNHAANTYKLWLQTQRKKEADQDPDTPAQEEKKFNLYSVKLTRMALVNMSKDFYYLRRVSDDGMPTGANFEIGGAETVKKASGDTYTFNYVVDTDAEQKQTVDGDGKKTGITAANASTFFNFTLFDKTGENYNSNGWYADQLSYVLDASRDSDTWPSQQKNSGQYKIWRYVTENTIPQNIKDPKNPNSLQQVQQSTGVVFKAAIIPGEDFEKNVTYPDSEEEIVSDNVKAALQAAAEGLAYGSDGATGTYAYPILYSFDNNLYAGIGDLIKAAVADGVGGRLYSAVKRILNHWTIEYIKVDGSNGADPEYVLPTKGAFKYIETVPATKDPATFYLTPEFCNDNEIFGNLSNSADGFSIDFEGTNPRERENGESLFVDLAPKEGITIYKASNEAMGHEATDGSEANGWGYYCYYFYWNRHNDNSKSGLMGPMEFATVRNNVYKLAVTKISQFGHPRVKTFDPDPVDENDPDEDPMAYIQVQVEVLPWVVRVNEIEF